MADTPNTTPTSGGNDNGDINGKLGFETDMDKAMPVDQAQQSLSTLAE